MTDKVVELKPRPVRDHREILVAEIINTTLGRRGYSEKFRQFVIQKATKAITVDRLNKWHDPVPMALPAGLQQWQVEAITKELTSTLANMQRDFLMELIRQAEMVASLEWQARELGFEVKPVTDL